MQLLDLPHLKQVRQTYRQTSSSFTCAHRHLQNMTSYSWRHFIRNNISYIFTVLKQTSYRPCNATLTKSLPLFPPCYVLPTPPRRGRGNRWSSKTNVKKAHSRNFSALYISTAANNIPVGTKAQDWQSSEGFQRPPLTHRGRGGQVKPPLVRQYYGQIHLVFTQRL